MTNQELIDAAIQASKKAYTPYSGFKVGAALEAEDGTVFTGCNIENASFTPTVCAERVALFSAVKEGTKKFRKVAIVGSKTDVFDKHTYPCGVCRQALSEFCGPDFLIITTDGKTIKETPLSELIPYTFTSMDLLEQNDENL